MFERYMPDMQTQEDVPMLFFPEEYAGQQSVKLCCTQHFNPFYRPDITEYRQKKITKAWADFLNGNIQPMEMVQFCTKTNQAIFDAVCHYPSFSLLYAVKEETIKSDSFSISLSLCLLC